MAARFILPKRLPITTLALGKRAAPAFTRSNSSTSAATSQAARLVEMARAAEKPSPLEAAVPVMWAVSGALIYTAWSRIEKDEGDVEKLLIV